MLALHAPTLHFVAVLVTVVAAGVSLLTWYHHRDGPGLRGWALALLLGSAGTFLFGLRGPDPSFRFILMGDALFVAGFATMWLSMRRFNDPAMGAELAGVIVAAIVLVFVALFVFILASLAAWETWRGRQLDGLRSRPIAALALAGIAVARLAQAVMVSADGLDVIESEVVVIAQGYALYFTTVCTLVVTFGLVLMAHERFERQNVISTEAGRAAE